MTNILIAGIEFIKKLVMFVFPEISLAPDLLSNLGTYIDTFMNWLSMVNFLVPLSDIYLIIVLILVAKISTFALFIINWLIRRLADFFP